MNYNKASTILGVTKEDTIEVIRKKYIKLIAKYHPDTNQSSDAIKKTQEINIAYDYLKKYYQTKNIKTSNNKQKNNQHNNNSKQDNAINDFYMEYKNNKSKTKRK